MKIHHLRNATFVMESGPNHILIDPMLAEKGRLPPFSYFRHPPRRNPTVDLPENAGRILDRVTHCLITHCQKWGLAPLAHTDHLDPEGKRFLRERNVPVVCHRPDASYLKKEGIRVEVALGDWKTEDFLGGSITAVPARHGRGWIGRLMAHGAGFHLALPDEPSFYISGDTVLTHEAKRALAELAPDIAVVAAGGARLDAGGPILMPMEEVLGFVEKAPGRVMANHLEALNHCPMTRAALKRELEKRGLLAKTAIPDDGETLSYDAG